MELRRQVAKKTMEVSTTQGREGNIAWIKRQLKEAVRHHCKTARSTEAFRGKAYKFFQGLRSDREGSLCSSRQCAEKKF
jgi:hypothetical protein